MTKTILALLGISLLFSISISIKAQDVEVTQTEVIMRTTEGTVTLQPDGRLQYYQTDPGQWKQGIISHPGHEWGVGFEVDDPTLDYTFRVYGNGTVEQNHVVIHSDSTLKTDIEELNSEIDNFKKLKGVKYHLKKEKKEKSIAPQRYGLLAQDLEKIYPDMVFTSETNIKSINYIELIPVLINVVQEQQERIETLEKEVLKIKSK